MRENRIVQVVWKDEGDFGFITTLTASDVAYREANQSLGVPFDPDRVRSYGSLEEAQALAKEHGAELVVS
jgi:cysteinyl-tRNA synthetase